MKTKWKPSISKHTLIWKFVCSFRCWKLPPELLKVFYISCITRKLVACSGWLCHATLVFISQTESVIRKMKSSSFTPLQVIGQLFPEHMRWTNGGFFTISLARTQDFVTSKAQLVKTKLTSTFQKFPKLIVQIYLFDLVKNKTNCVCLKMWYSELFCMLTARNRILVWWYCLYTNRTCSPKTNHFNLQWLHLY